MSRRRQAGAGTPSSQQRSGGFRSLADIAYNSLESMLVTLQLEPGGVISEGDLSTRLGIGRTPLREALQRLAALQLVAALPRRGILVREINVADMLGILETRRVLDRLIAVLAAKRSTEDQRAALRSCANDLEDAAAAGDLERYLEIDRRFDDIVERATRNASTAHAVAPLHIHCRRFWYLHRNEGDLSAASRLHTALMLAIASCDSERAAAASDHLLDYLEQFTRASLDHFGRG